MQMDYEFTYYLTVIEAARSLSTVCLPQSPTIVNLRTTETLTGKEDSSLSSKPPAYLHYLKMLLVGGSQRDRRCSCQEAAECFDRPRRNRRIM